MSAEFVPAKSLSEAASRIFTLSGQPPLQSRGPKRALVALARTLGLDVDIEATNAVLGRLIAAAFDAEWPDDASTRTNQITLVGMNLLLSEAAAFRNQSISRQEPVYPFPLPQWPAGFVPATSKIAVVNRISALTDSGPEELGPGSKERKSVLVNLAVKLFPDLDPTVSKTQLGEDLAKRFGLPWLDTFTSTGYTITLDGLNTILAGAERYLGRLGGGAATFKTAAEEGVALAAALRAGLPRHWDGRDCVTEMRDDEYSKWRSTEWPGWYAEFRGFPILNEAFPIAEDGGPKRKYGHTVFDYALDRVWDLKSHTAEKLFLPSGKQKKNNSPIILNDARAVQECIAEQGLGFLVVSGLATFDETKAFDVWHRKIRQAGRKPKSMSNSGNSRPLKMAFDPLCIDAYWIPDTAAYNAAITAGSLSVQRQGRQAKRGDQDSGDPRKDKLHLSVSKATNLHVGSVPFDRPT